MASLHSAMLSALQFHQRPSNLGLRIDSTRTLTSTVAPPRLLEPFPLSTRTLASDRLVPPLPRISCSRTPRIPPLSRQNASFLGRIAGGAAVLLIGSLVFLGRLGTRSASALDGAERSNFSAPLEEKIDASGEDEVEMYARVLQKNPKDVEALKVVLYGKLKKGKREEAVRLVERLIELEPDEVEWRLLQGLCYELMGKLDKAKRLFRDILKERPLLIRALHGLALAMHKSRESAAAFEMLHKALDLARRENRVTEERNIKILIAQMHVIVGDLEGASQHFQDLVNDDPRDFRPYLCQGIIYSLLDKKKEAEEQFEIYRSLLPDEFPQRSFIDDVILAAKTEAQQLGKELKSEYSPQK
ncbi:chloroplast lumen common family protein [Musa troglodytarum]|uniref:Chloroplast lumen common family protein n=1 Tax=Musa troglodytarum TaxID=320322 RepID=A0A9E7KA55_9LILI|nr:chloroplast lumen common family protein [Musa troglodytarum]